MWLRFCLSGRLDTDRASLQAFAVEGNRIGMSDDSLLQQSVAALSQYFVGDATLESTLHRVSELTIGALPQTTHVGLTMLVDGKPGTAVFTHPEVQEIDTAQYRSGIGPCLDGFRDGRVYYIESMDEPGRWGEFARSAAEHGVRSSLSLPLIARDVSFGALNLYASSERAYSAADVDLAEAFATQAAFLLANAQAYWDARDLSENLTRAMESRSAIEQAKGILMATLRIGPDEAFRRLVEQSQYQNVKLRDIAVEIVANVQRSAGT